MADKKVVKVLIAGKVMTMSGYESEEYMQKVAAYINSKIEEYEKTNAFRHASSDIRHRMLELNFADSYFKEKEHAEDLEQRLKDKIDELDEMKHNYVNSQVLVEDQKKDVGSLESKLHESEKTITELKTRLMERDKTIAQLEAELKEGHGNVRSIKREEGSGGVYTQQSLEDMFGEEAKKENGTEAPLSYQERRNGKRRR
ncbi:MAG: cell division protein ZapA [Lachnospiraceae bacterium]|nr:cell division protein ZapA [Lachnospiraceae bacterium]